MTTPKKVLFLVPYPLRKAPSQRFRVENFLPVLQQAGIEYHVDTFLDDATWDILYKKASPVKKALGVVKGFGKRLKTVLFQAPKYDYVFIHREASPIGPPVFEWIVSKVLRKKVIYDFDDAIWIPNTSRENKLVSWVKAFWKIKYICRWSYKVSGGNEFLCAYAKKNGAKAVLVPTCVDMERQHKGLKQQDTPTIIIGWTGSHSTMKYLDAIVPVLRRIIEEGNEKGKAVEVARMEEAVNGRREINAFSSPSSAPSPKVEVLIISNKPPQFDLPGLRYIPWQEASEIQDLLQLNIGLMPLEDDAWSEGKCGFKLIQYLALGIPAVASPVGVNKAIIENGVNGFLCTEPEEWYQALKLLIEDAALRQRMGVKGQVKMESHYSISSAASSFVGLFS